MLGCDVFSSVPTASWLLPEWCCEEFSEECTSGRSSMRLSSARRGKMLGADTAVFSHPQERTERFDCRRCWWPSAERAASDSAMLVGVSRPLSTSVPSEEHRPEDTRSLREVPKLAVRTVRWPKGEAVLGSTCLQEEGELLREWSVLTSTLHNAIFNSLSSLWPTWNFIVCCSMCGNTSATLSSCSRTSPPGLREIKSKQASA
mmetsp:Transcript_110914/g.358059  ORF Transcript_110914/g.358059 Transcript_110914/m.358059 type:complete len:203 (-) Transcript_110914:1091-1699(-)